jgi:hypothetical protein
VVKAEPDLDKAESAFAIAGADIEPDPILGMRPTAMELADAQVDVRAEKILTSTKRPMTTNGFSRSRPRPTPISGA